MTTPGASRQRSRVTAALPTVLAVVLLLVAGRWFAERWDAVVAGGERPSIAFGWIAVAFLVLLLHAGSALLIWHRMLGAVGARVPLRVAFDSFAPSLLARYVPGKIWANTVRLALSRRAGVRYGATTGAILWETLIALGSAGVVALAGLAGRAEPGVIRGAVILLALTLLAWTAARLLVRHPRGAALLERVASGESLRRPRALAAPLAFSLAGWLLYGLAHWAVARALAPVAAADLPLMAGAVALAWAGGYLAVVMPVGLGVRDGILLVILAPLLDPAQALVFVAMSRVVQLAADSAVTALWLIRPAVVRAAADSAPSA